MSLDCASNRADALIAGRYRTEELIGSGGMAEVYRAWDTATRQLVAVKIPHATGWDGPMPGPRFRQEQRFLAGLAHPSIVRILDCGEDLAAAGDPETHRPYIVTEFVDGVSLRDMLKSGRPEDISVACAITARVLSALDHTHRQGIVHGDISPGNVMVCASAQVKIMDFGGAQLIPAPDATVSDSIVRTPRYMAPEQALGQPVDPRTDIYASGCLLYTLLAGQPPFPGEDPVALAFQHVHQDPAPPSAHRPQVSHRLDTIVLHALAKRPADRYQNAAGFRSDVLAAMHALPDSGDL